MTFSAEELRLIIDLERRMDAGEVPYIYVAGSHERAAMDPAHMQALGLEIGQTVSVDLWIEILKFKIEQLDREIAHSQVGEILAEEVGS